MCDGAYTSMPLVVLCRSLGLVRIRMGSQVGFVRGLGRFPTVWVTPSFCDWFLYGQCMVLCVL